MFAGAELRKLCLRPDQEAVEAEIAAFIGPRADYYLKRYRKMRNRVARGRSPGWAMGWSRSAFGSWFAWYWYRHLWVEGAVALALPFVAGWLFSHAGRLFGADPDTMDTVGDLLAYLASVLFANGLYLRSVASALVEPAEPQAGDPAWLALLRQPRGISGIGLVAELAVWAVICIVFYQSQRAQIDQIIDQASEISDQ